MASSTFGVAAFCFLLFFASISAAGRFKPAMIINLFLGIFTLAVLLEKVADWTC